MDLLSPELNINKTAGSMLEFKHTKDNIKFKLDNKLFTKNEHNLSIKPGISQKTILKLELYSIDIVVSIYDKNSKLIREFNRIKTAAEFVGLSFSSVSGYMGDYEIIFAILN